MHWLEHLQFYGYALLPSCVTSELLDEHSSRVDELMSRFQCGHNVPWTTLDASDRILMEGELNLLELGDGSSMPLAFVPEIQDRMREAFADEPILTWARTRLWEAGNRSPHFDTAALSTTPSHQVLRTWCALEDVSSNSGVLFVYPGTHRTLPDEICEEVYSLSGVKDQVDRLSELYKEAGNDPSAMHPLPEWKQLHASIWPAICEAVERATKDLERVTFPLSKGDVVVFNPRVVHGTMERQDASLPRKSQICEWRAQTARLYFLTEHFGRTRDLRSEPGAGRSAMHRAVRTPWGVYAEPQD